MCKPAGALILKRHFKKIYLTYIRPIQVQIFQSEEPLIEKKDAFPPSSVINTPLTNIHCIFLKTKVKRNFSQMKIVIVDIKNKS